MASAGRLREEGQALLSGALEVLRGEWEQLRDAPPLLSQASFAKPNPRALEACLCTFFTVIAGRAKAKKVRSGAPQGHLATA